MAPWERTENRDYRDTDSGGAERTCLPAGAERTERCQTQTAPLLKPCQPVHTFLAGAWRLLTRAMTIYGTIFGLLSL